MQLLQSLHAVPILRSLRIEASASRLLAWIAAHRGEKNEVRLESPMAGKAWTDTTERELNDNIANGRFSRG